MMQSNCCGQGGRNAVPACGLWYADTGSVVHPVCGRRKEEKQCCCAGDASGVGMVYAVCQQLEQLLGLEEALRFGTLFPELHKPMNGHCPASVACISRERALAFAIWEVRLYLDTHPCDEKALALLRRLMAAAEGENYATSFLPDCGDGWTWTQGPWPWEYGCVRRDCCEGRNADVCV